QLRDVEQEPKLVIRVHEHHRLPPLRSPALNQHQGTETGRIHLAGRGEIDDELPGALGQRLEHLHGCLAELDTSVESEALGGAKLPSHAVCGPHGASHTRQGWRANLRLACVHLRHRAISPLPSPADETSSFAAPDRSGCALIGRIFLNPGRTMRPAHPRGESNATAFNPFTHSGLKAWNRLALSPCPPQSATDPGEVQPGSG